MTAAETTQPEPVYAISEPYRIGAGRDAWWAVDMSNNRTIAHETLGAAKQFCREHRKEPQP